MCDVLEKRQLLRDLWIWKSIICLSLVAFGLYATPQAEACQPEPPTLEWLSIKHEATGIPRNASIWAKLRGSIEKESFTYSLTGPNGAIPLKSAGEAYFVQLTPAETLQANTSYTLSVGCTGNFCYAGKDEKVVSFSTGTQEAKAAAPYTGVDKLTYSAIPAYKAQHMCEGDRAAYFRITIRGAVAEQAAFYNLYLASAPQTVVSRWQLPTAIYSLALSKDGQEICFYLRAVNHAGQEDTNNNKVCITPKLKEGQEPTTESTTEKAEEIGVVDAGPDNQADTQTKPDGSLDVRIGGCACHQTNTSASSLGAGLLLMLLWMGWMRRRSER